MQLVFSAQEMRNKQVNLDEFFHDLIHHIMYDLNVMETIIRFSEIKICLDCSLISCRILFCEGALMEFENEEECQKGTRICGTYESMNWRPRDCDPRVQICWICDVTYCGSCSEYSFWESCELCGHRICSECFSQRKICNPCFMEKDSDEDSEF